MHMFASVAGVCAAHSLLQSNRFCLLALCLNSIPPTKTFIFLLHLFQAIHNTVIILLTLEYQRQPLHTWKCMYPDTALVVDAYNFTSVSYNLITKWFPVTWYRESKENFNFFHSHACALWKLNILFIVYISLIAKKNILQDALQLPSGSIVKYKTGTHSLHFRDKISSTYKFFLEKERYFSLPCKLILFDSSKKYLTKHIERCI